MWTAVSGSIAQGQQLDIVSNNLANAETAGFKKDEATFSEMLAAQSKNTPGGQDAKLKYGRMREADFYPLDGRDTSFVEVGSVTTDFAQGHLKGTGGPLDLALEGKGFLEVLTPNGVRFTRAGNLKISQEGMLVTSDGYPVLSKRVTSAGVVQPVQGSTSEASGVASENIQGGIKAEQGALTKKIDPNDPKTRTISLADLNGRINITEDGSIFVGENKSADLSVIEFKDLKKLIKEGAGFFENKEDSNISKEQFTTKTRQGFIEVSNVNAVSELVKMLKVSKVFEASQKAMKAYSDMMKADLGKLQ